MTPPNSPAIPSSLAAPRRAAPLTAAPKPPPVPDRKAVEAALALAKTAAKAPNPKAAAAARPAIEVKIAAAGHDADAILRTLNTEMALRRAGRSIKGNDHIKALRVLSVAMLFTLLIGALGAMSYVQTQFTSHGFKHHAPNASPAPGPSVPSVDPARQSAPPR